MLRQVTPPTAEPVTLAEVRIHLRQLGDDETDPPTLYEVQVDDSWLAAKVTAARQYAEDFIGYPLTDAVYVVAADAFGDSLTLPTGAREVVSISYLDASNAEQVLDPSAYYFDEFGAQALWISDLPAISSRANAVRVRFRGSYGAVAPVPETIKHALLLMVAHWYENREASLIGQVGVELPLGVDALLRPHRLRLGMA